jgi:glucose/arabinose dehydrogenase
MRLPLRTTILAATTCGAVLAPAGPAARTSPSVLDAPAGLPARGAWGVADASPGAPVATLADRSPPAPAAANLPAGFTETLVAGGLDRPTAFAFAPDGRIFVTEQGGAVRVIQNGTVLDQPFVTLTVNAVGERGLLGIAFDPAFATNGFVYLYYTATTPTLHNRVSRFRASGNVAAPGSEVPILDLENLGATNHNGGALHFGPDGKLYVAVGENGTASNAQTLANRLGKILRLNPDGSIPPDNPFFGAASGANRAIWALGLRNPFTFAFERGTGRMFVNDVGQNAWEEINEGIRGANYGWPATEGPHSDPRFVQPLFAYGHGDGATTGCAITGGAFYDVAGPFPAEYRGDFFFGDFCSGWIRRFDPATGQATGFATGLLAPVDLRVQPDGALYYLDRGLGRETGVVRRIAFDAGGAPSITRQPAHQVVSIGQSATFSVEATGAAPLRFQWQRNGAAIPGATGPSFTLSPVSQADDGATFRVVVSNAIGDVTSLAATLTVLANVPPAASITSPAEGALYVAGRTFEFAGSGSDPEDGTLPAGAFTWQVDFHHADHVHPFLPPTAGVTSGSFEIPNTGETAANVFYRVRLTVTDSRGARHSTFRDLLPRVSTIRLATNPAGLRVTLDGQPVRGPVQLQGVAGILRTLGAVSPQSFDGSSWLFDGWSDGGAAVHQVTTRRRNQTYTARYVRAPDSDDDGIPSFVESAEGTNPQIKDNDVFGSARLFVMQQYRDLLGREGLPDGIAYWAAAIDQGRATRPQVVEFFRASPEYRETVGAATRLAIACLPGIPDFERLIGWTNRLRDGGTLEEVAADCAGEPEFRSRYDALSNTEFVRRIFLDVVEREPAAAGLQFWVGRLNGGAPRFNVLLALAESDEHRALVVNEALVQELFLTLLRREPTAGELASRVAQLASGGTAVQVITDIQQQGGYRQRFLP